MRAVVDAGDLARAMQDVTHGMEPFDKRKRLEARREMEAELRQAERLALVPVPRSEGMARREPVSVRRPQFGGWRVG